MTQQLRRPTFDELIAESQVDIPTPAAHLPAGVVVSGVLAAIGALALAAVLVLATWSLVPLLAAWWAVRYG